MPKGYRLLSDDLPAFGLRLGGAFLNADSVPDCECLGLIMGAIFLGLPDRLLKNRVLEAALYRDSHGLGVGCRCDGAGQDTFGHLSGLPYASLAAAAAFWFSTVFTRATLRRTSRMRAVFSS